MENIKLFELLSTFSKDEIADFGLFLDSPFHNSSKQAKQLFQIIRKHFPNLSHKELRRENIFRKFYPGEEYKDKKIRDLFSVTNKLAEEFLGYNYAEKEGFFLRRGALREMVKRDLSKHFEQKKRETEAELEKLPVKDDHYFYYTNRLLYDTRSYYVTKTTIPKSEPLYKGMEQEIEQFVLYFVSKMLYYYSHQLSHEMLLKHESSLTLVDELIGFLNRKELNQYPQIRVLYLLVILLRDRSNNEIMLELEELLNVNDIMIAPDLLRDAYTVLYNCNKEFAVKGSEYFDIKSYRIMKRMIEKKVLPTENGKLDEQGFIVIVGEALSHKDFDWAENFIEENYPKLKPEVRSNYYKFAMGQLRYRTKNYDEALKCFLEVESEDFNIFTILKLDTIRIYFEMKEYEGAQNIVDSFRHHLKSNIKLLDTYKRRYLNFLKYIGSAITCLLKDDHESLYLIKQEIEAAPVFENRKWLIAQLTEILKKQKHKK